MNIWRLIAHHEDSQHAVAEMTRRDRIAIGWTATGDLRSAGVESPTDITQLITASHPELDNAHLGGPSLWSLFRRMQLGDSVIVAANGRRDCVFEVTGAYLYEEGPNQILGYGHQRPAVLTAIDPEDLWPQSGQVLAPGENIRWTLVACTQSESANDAIYEEGKAYSVTSTAIERNPYARQACIDYFGTVCFVCKVDMGQRYGELGAGYIHVHHIVPVSSRSSEYTVNPTKDLVPLCPNCHSMAHRDKPPVSLKRLKDVYEKHNA